MMNNSNMYFLGGDISLNHGAITIVDSNGDHVYSCWYSDVAYLCAGKNSPCASAYLVNKSLSRCQKLYNLKNIFGDPLHNFGQNDIYSAIEDYAFGVRSSSLTSLAEASGVFKLCYATTKAIAEVPPTLLKKYAAGTGGAKKEHMLRAAKENCGIDFISKFSFNNCGNLSAVEDICDSYYLARFMRDYVYATRFGVGVDEALNSSSAYAFSKVSKLKVDSKKETDFRKKFLCVE